MKQILLNLPEPYVKALDRMVKAKLYPSRNEAIRLAVRDLLNVEKWKPVPPRDPILVKRLTPNLFGVLATWDLTKLERAVIRGRIQ